MKFATYFLDNKIFVNLNVNLENYTTPRRCKE